MGRIDDIVQLVLRKGPPAPWSKLTTDAAYLALGDAVTTQDSRPPHRGR